MIARQEQPDGRRSPRSMRRGTLIGVLAALLALGVVIGLGWLTANSTHTSSSRPTTGEVEREVPATFRRDGEVAHVGCQHTTTNQWNCRVRFSNGREVTVAARWYKSQDELGISVEHRTSPPH